MATETAVTITDAQRHRLRQAGKKLSTATERRADAVAECRQLARDMHAAGMTEVELAALFQVDRARTIRRWLGKMTN